MSFFDFKIVYQIFYWAEYKLQQSHRESYL